MFTKLQQYVKRNWLEIVEVTIIVTMVPYYLYAIYIAFF